WRRRHFFEGRATVPTGEKDLTWFATTGQEMTSEHWGQADLRVLGMRLYGCALDEPDMRGLPFVEEILLVLFNARDAATSFVLPAPPPGASEPDHWKRLIDTANWPLDPDVAPPETPLTGGTAYP